MSGDLSQSPDATRQALVAHLCRRLGPLFPDDGAQLSLWLSRISTGQLIASISVDAEATADALADALVGAEPVADVAGLLAVAASLAFPRMPGEERGRLVTFAMTVRRLARESGDVVTADQLATAGYGSVQVARLMPRAQAMLGALAGTEPAAKPGQRLAALGAQAARAVAA